MFSSKPQFKYLVLLKSAMPEYGNNYKRPQTPQFQEKQITCFADGFETKEDGSLVFYQVARPVSSSPEAKNIKVTVLAYPSGKWETCMLMSSNDDLVAFSTHNSFGGNLNYGGVNESRSSNAGHQNNGSPFKDDDSAATASTDVSASRTGANMSSSGINNESRNGNGNGNGNSNGNISIPGFSNNAFGGDFNKMKREFMEAELRRYFTEYDKFTLPSFTKHLTVASRAAGNKFNISENDIQFNISYAIKKGKFPAHKFLNPEIKNILDMHLPPIIRRHWDQSSEKTNVIMEILQDRDETKIVSQIDLATWLSLNGHLKK